MIIISLLVRSELPPVQLIHHDICSRFVFTIRPNLSAHSYENDLLHALLVFLQSICTCIRTNYTSAFPRLYSPMSADYNQNVKLTHETTQARRIHQSHSNKTLSIHSLHKHAHTQHQPNEKQINTNSNTGRTHTYLNKINQTQIQLNTNRLGHYLNTTCT